MEVAGLIIGGIALSSLFTQCVDCFEYIQLGRQFGDKYERSLLQIELLKLRLSRWGSVVNRIQDKTSQDDAKVVKAVLSDIVNLFDHVEKLAEDDKLKNPGTELQVYNEHPDPNSTVTIMCQRVKNLAMKRQNRSSLKKKAKWALYQQKDFEYLIEQVSRYLDSLEAWCSTASALQITTSQLNDQFCAEDVHALADSHELGLLEEGAKGTDPGLLKIVVARNEGHTYTNNNTVQSTILLGDYVAKDYTGDIAGKTNNYERNKAFQSKAVYGTNYGGKSPFD
ncbi:hypothetical protein ACLMJK_009298 [Lecanora helva]